MRERLVKAGVTVMVIVCEIQPTNVNIIMILVYPVPRETLAITSPTPLSLILYHRRNQHLWSQIAQ